MQDKISIILPTYNEAGNIIGAIELIAKLLQTVTENYEIIVVDDASPDQTYAIVKCHFQNNPHVRAFIRTSERGLSSAVTYGFHQATGKYLFVADADFQHDYTILPEMFNLLKSNDLVVASRRLSPSGYGEFSWIRKTMSLLATKLTEWSLQLPITDPMSGYFGIRKEVFTTISPRLKPRGYKILLEICGSLPSLRVSEVGYEFGLRRWGNSKLDSSVVFHFVIDLLAIKWSRSFQKWFGEKSYSWEISEQKHSTKP